MKPAEGWGGWLLRLREAALWLSRSRICLGLSGRSVFSSTRAIFTGLPASCPSSLPSTEAARWASGRGLGERRLRPEPSDPSGDTLLSFRRPLPLALAAGR